MTCLGWSDVFDNFGGAHFLQVILDAVRTDSQPGCQLTPRDRWLRFEQGEDFALGSFLGSFPDSLPGFGVPGCEFEHRPQPGRFVSKSRRWQARSRATRNDALDSATPGLNHAGPKKGIGHIRVERLGGMLRKQFLDRPISR